MALDQTAVDALSDQAKTAFAAGEFEKAAQLIAEARAAYAAENITITQGPDGGVLVVA